MKTNELIIEKQKEIIEHLKAYYIKSPAVKIIESRFSESLAILESELAVLESEQTEEGETFRKVWIKYESDLPKLADDYFVSHKDGDKNWYPFSKIGHFENINYWLNHIEWYLLPLDKHESKENEDWKVMCFDCGTKWDGRTSCPVCFPHKEITKTSFQWSQNCDYKILDPDGWDRVNWDYSWHEEEITFKEFEKRLFMSTIEPKPKSDPQPEPAKSDEDTKKCKECGGRTALIHGYFNYEPDDEPYMSLVYEKAKVEDGECWVGAYKCDDCGNVQDLWTE
jgi:hypothetical protein